MSHDPQDPPLAAPDPARPSDRELDQLAFGELSGEDKARVEALVAASPEAQRRLDERHAGFPAGVDEDALFARIADTLADEGMAPEADGVIANALKPGQAAAKPAAKSFWQRVTEWTTSGWQPKAMLAAVTAVAALVAVQLGGGQDPLGGGGVLLKGTVGLTVHKQVVDGSETLISGATLAAGDRLRFEVDVPVDGHLLIVGVDAAGVSGAAWPLGAAVSAPISKGNDQQLDGAVVLDASQGREWFHAVLCAAPVQLSQVKPGSQAGAVTVPSGCKHTTFGLVKAP